MSTTGYFARPTVGKRRAKWTMTHVVRNNKVLCGYKPHRTMMFQWCGNSDVVVAECAECRRKAQNAY